LPIPAGPRQRKRDAPFALAQSLLPHPRGPSTTLARTSTPACTKMWWLGNLGYPQHIPIECSGFILAPNRHRKLDVIYVTDLHGNTSTLVQSGTGLQRQHLSPITLVSQQDRAPSRLSIQHSRMWPPERLRP
jgi:hypothetical protein